jgi:hypothetical protein
MRFEVGSHSFLHGPGFKYQYAAATEVQNKDIPRRLEISESFLKGK